MMNLIDELGNGLGWPWLTANYGGIAIAPHLAVTTDDYHLKVATTAIGLTIAALMFATSKLFGELMVRFSLPHLLGDLLAGIVLGVSVLHIIVRPEATDQLSGLLSTVLPQVFRVSSEQVVTSYESWFTTIQAIGEWGLLCLLFRAGMESDVQQMIRFAPQAATVALTGVVLPFAIGTWGLLSLFDVSLMPALFGGAALSATSIGITAEVLQELGQLRSDEGQIILGAALLDDILGIIILAVVVALAEEGGFDLQNTGGLILSAIAFIGIALLLTRFFAPLFDALVDHFQMPGSLITAAFIFLCLMSLTAAALNLETVIGAFAAGVVLAHTRRSEEIEQQVQPLVTLLATVFFILIGTQTDLTLLNPLDAENWDGLLIAAFLIVAAIAGKLLAGFLTLSAAPINRIAIGTGMIPRGEVGLVFVGLGVATGTLSQALEVGLFLMVIMTTFAAPLLLRLNFQAADTALGSHEQEPTA